MKTYLQRINALLVPKMDTGLNVVDLFSGCGGLSLGFEAVGFKTQGFESASEAVSTYNLNLLGSSETKWLDQNFICPPTEVVIGGPPCQPFSRVGLQKGKSDIRDGLPVFLNVLRSVRPKIWMFENVPGLSGHREYLSTVMRTARALGYRVERQVVDTSHYGVPQRRRRLVVVGWQKGQFHWPEPSLPLVTAGDAIGRMIHSVPPNVRFLTPAMELYIARYEKASKCKNPRDLVLDRPARTVTCRNLYGATGDMLRVRTRDGRRRMLSVREAARLQSFPDWFRFCGSEASQFTQIGNAVPPLLGWHFAQAFRSHLNTL